MDLNKMVNDSLAKIQAEGCVEKAVDKRVKETVESIVSDLFSSYSDFGKSLKKEVQSCLNVNFERLNLASYNVLVLNTIQTELDKVIHQNGIDKIKESLADMLNVDQKEYKLSELIHDFKEDVLNDKKEYQGERISFHFEEQYGSIYIYFDKDAGKAKYSCQYRIWAEKDGKVTTITIDDKKKFDNKVIMGGLWGFDQTLFKIYASGAKIIFDTNCVVVEYGYQEDDEDED